VIGDRRPSSAKGRRSMPGQDLARQGDRAGSTVHESIIWAGHYKRGLFSSYGLVGLVNIELTPEYCARLGASFAALFPKGAAIAAARDGQRPSRMIKRAMVAGMISSGAAIIRPERAAHPGDPVLRA